MKKLFILLLLITTLFVQLPLNCAFAEDETQKGIDVSSWQGSIDWDKVSQTEVDFAIIRCGYGKDTASQDDSYWIKNADACTRLGIPFGTYLYSYATNVESAKSEAAHVLRLIKGYKLDYPIFLDLEDSSISSLPAGELGAIAQTFCDIIQGAGYEVGIYSSKSWWTSKLTDADFNNSTWHKWVAQWGSSCTYGGSYTMWQYSDAGSVDGISGRVDMDYWYGEPVSSSGGEPQSPIDDTVTFDPNGGYCFTSYITASSGSIYGNLPTPIRIGYSFDGWYTAADGGTQITSSTTVPVISEQTLYAHWTRERYLTDIVISSKPEKTAYKVGEALDLTGLVVTGTYDDGSIGAVTVAAENVTGFDSSKAVAKQTLTVKIDEMSVSFTISIKDEIQTVPVTIKTFNDLGGFEWAVQQIETLKAAGIINGTSSTTYSPGANIKRADFVTLLVRALSLKADVTGNFNDVKAADYYYGTVGIAKKLGITEGVGNNCFNPNASITREDMMVITAKALKIAGYNLTQATIEQLAGFIDAASISGYAKDYVATLTKSGIVTGGGNKINPQGNTTRAEVAVMLYRAINAK